MLQREHWRIFGLQQSFARNFVETETAGRQLCRTTFRDKPFAHGESLAGSTRYSGCNFAECPVYSGRPVTAIDTWPHHAVVSVISKNRLHRNVNIRSKALAHPLIPKDQIDLWTADLDADEHSENKLSALLSPDECDRARRFRFPIDRTRYTIRRGILRTLLGRYLDAAPESIPISNGPHGKPALPTNAIHFNQSHSGSQACFAFSCGSPLGIDLEYLRPMPDLLRVSEGFCSSAELRTLEALPPEEQVKAFFRCWTRKEALGKALGQGLSYPLDRISVSFDEPARLLGLPADHGELMDWHFHHWEPGPEYVGAVVSRHPDSRIIRRRFPEYQEEIPA